MRYVGYTRQKPWRQTGKFLMIEEQTAMIMKYAKEKGLTIVKWYVDENEEDDSEKMKQMLYDGVGRRFEGLIVASFPYFATDSSTACQIAFESFYASGIQFVVVDDNFDSAKLNRKEVSGYFERKRRNMFSDLAKKRLSERDDLMLQKGIPYGYKPSEKELMYVKDEEVSDYVESIFRRYLAGDKALDIVRWLNENNVLNRGAYRQMKRGIETKRNTSWSAYQIKRMLKADIYTGKSVRKYGERVEEILAEPYITYEEQNYIITRIEGEKRVVKRNMSGRENPFMSKIFSLASGRSMFLHNGEDFVDSKYNGTRNKVMAAHSISFDEVMSKVLERTKEEKRCAEKAMEKILTGEALIAFQKARKVFSEQMKVVLEEIQCFLGKGLHEPELKAFDEKAAAISKEFKRIELAFSPKNPWIVLFFELDISETIDREMCRKIIERIDITEDYGDLNVQFKQHEMKNYLPQEWWKEGDD